MVKLSIGEYIKNVRIKKGFKSQRQLAISTGLSNGTIARIENGTQKPQVETLSQIAKVLGEDPKNLWKIAGYFSNEETDEIHITNDLKIFDNDQGNNRLSPSTSQIPIIHNLDNESQLFSSTNIEGYVPIPGIEKIMVKDLFLMIARDDSFIGGRIIYGDMLLIQKCNSLENGNLFLVQVEGFFGVVKVKKSENGETWIIPINDYDYDPFLLSENELKIIGKVLQVIIKT